MSRQVFLSYSTDDTTITTAVRDHLEGQSIACWMAPRDITPGNDYGGQIIDAIEAATLLVLILSESFNQSLFVRNEVERAVAKGKVIIPFRIEPVQPSRSLEFFISNFQWVEAWEPPLPTKMDSLAQAIRTHLVAHSPHSPVTPPPLLVMPSPPHNLPHQLTSFIGRKSELAALDELLNQADVRLITILGAGGMGKTRLSLAVADRHLTDTRFADGVFFVRLALLGEVQHIVPKVAETLSFSLQSSGDGRTPEQQLLDYLRAKSMLLLFDNFEHLLDGTGLVVQILQAAPHVRIIVTSRERLRVPGEHLFPLQGLEYPRAIVDPAAAGSAAVQLFLQGAHQLQPDLEFTEEELLQVAHICRLVDGMPLGIELAAAWIEVLSPAEIAVEIQRSLDFLESARRGGEAHQRSVRAVFDSTWQRLNQEEQRVFARMSIFHGGFTREAAEQVAGASLRHLGALASKSLIQHDRERGRYQIHELLRQYGSEKLASSPEAVSDAHTAHADYFLTYLNERALMYRSFQQVRAIREIGAEYENARAAWKWSVAHLQTREQTATIAGAVQAMTTFHQCQSRYLEGAELLAAAIRLLERYDPSFSAPMAEKEGKNAVVEVNASALAECLISSSFLAIRLGSPAEAEHSLKRARRIYDLLLPHYHYHFFDVPMAFMILRLVQGDYEGAAALAQETRLQAQQQNDLWHIPLTLYGSASASLAQGQYKQAREYAEQGLTLMESLGNRWLSILAHDILGQIASIQGDLQAAKRHFEAAYAVGEEFGAPGVMALHLKNLGDIALLQQQWAESHAFYRQSLERYHFIGDRGGAVAAERGLGVASNHLGDLIGARRHFRQALETAVATDTNRLVLSVLAAAGEFLAEQPGVGRRQTLGLQILRFVAQYASTDQTTRNEAAGYLQRKSASLNGSADDSLEMLTAALQAELNAVPERLLPPA